MPQFDVHDFAPQLVWLVISFVALYFIMARVALPRIGAVIEQRRDRIASDLDQAEELKRKTEEAIAAYEQGLAEARAKAHAITKDMREKLNAEIAAEQAEVDKKLTATAERAEKRIQTAMEAALSHVQDIASDTTGDIIKALIDQTPTKEEVASAVSKARAG